MNGITGLKPTFGRVPKSGVVPLGYSLDHVGPMARSARDCAAMLGIIAGYEPSDECCSAVAAEDYLAALDGTLRGVRIGVERAHHFPEDADPALAATFEAAVEVLSSLGATMVEVSLPYFEEMRAGLLATMLPEALAYHRDDLRSRWSDYYASTRVNIAFGALVESMDYVQAQRVRRLTQRCLGELFTGVDLVVMPTSPNPAQLIEEMAGNIVTRLLRTSFTSYWNMMGLPALALPMGFNAAGLPLSLQIAGRAFEEARVLRAGDAYQGVTDWHLRVPGPRSAAGCRRLTHARNSFRGGTDDHFAHRRRSPGGRRAPGHPPEPRGGPALPRLRHRAAREPRHLRPVAHRRDQPPDALPRAGQGVPARPGRRPVQRVAVEVRHRRHVRWPAVGQGVSFKDHVAVAGIPLTYNSYPMEGFVPDFDATIVTRVLEAGGSVIGKNTMNGFTGGRGLGGSLGGYGAPVNPHNHGPPDGRVLVGVGRGARRGRGGHLFRRRPGRLHPDPRGVLRDRGA